MYRSYCNQPGCPGHYKSWERCDHLRAFGRAQGCGDCAISSRCDQRAQRCPGLSGLDYPATRATMAGRVRGV